MNTSIIQLCSYSSNSSNFIEKNIPLKKSTLSKTDKYITIPFMVVCICSDILRLFI